MQVLLPRSLEEALAMKADHPEALPIAGGTDVMVDINFGRLRPPALMDVSRVAELSVVNDENGHVFLGSGVTYSAIVKGMTAFRPLVQASRSVGSPMRVGKSPIRKAHSCPSSWNCASFRMGTVWPRCS